MLIMSLNSNAFNLCRTGFHLGCRHFLHLGFSGKLVWSIRGLLDFNTLFGEWPHALPRSKGVFPGEPGGDAFAHLKEGYPWFHFEEEDTGIMVLVERIGDCDDEPEMIIYNYGVYGFYGWRGELPFQEKLERHDYTGFESHKCLHLTLRTGFNRSAIPGDLLQCCCSLCIIMN